MVVPEVKFQGVVVHIVLLLPSIISSIADMALFMLISAMGIQLIIAVKPLPAEATLRVALKTALIHGSRIIITEFFMLAKFGYCKQFMFVREDFLVPCAQITQNLAMQALDMPVKIRPSPTGNIATNVGAVVTE